MLEHEIEGHHILERLKSLQSDQQDHEKIENEVIYKFIDKQENKIYLQTICHSSGWLYNTVHTLQ